MGQKSLSEMFAEFHDAEKIRHSLYSIRSVAVWTISDRKAEVRILWLERKRGSQALWDRYRKFGLRRFPDKVILASRLKVGASEDLCQAASRSAGVKRTFRIAVRSTEVRQKEGYLGAEVLRRLLKEYGNVDQIPSARYFSGWDLEEP